VEKLLALQDAAAAALEKQRLSTEQEVSRAASARLDADQKIKDANTAIETQKKLADQLDLRQKELDKADRDIKDQATTLAKRITEIENLKREHIKLARAVMESELPTEDVAYMMAVTAMETYSPGDGENPAHIWLSDFPIHPGTNSIKLLQKLVGTKQSDLEAVLRKDLGFSVWMKLITSEDGAISKVSKPSQLYYCGWVSATEFAVSNLVVITLTDDSGGVKRVDDVNGYASVAVIKVPDAKNWNAEAGHILTQSYDGERETQETFPIDTANSKTWTIDRILVDQGKVSFEILHGKNRSFSFLSADRFRELDPMAYQTALTNEFDELAESMQMLINATNFTFPTKEANALAQIPDSLRPALEQLLVSSVQRNPAVSARWINSTLDPQTPGRIAAAALHNGFRFVRVEWASTRTLDVSQSISQSINRFANASIRPESGACTVYADYQRGSSRSGLEAVRFNFEKTETDWVLAGWGSIRYDNSRRTSKY
jgi:hypothetical protein